jgi:hypothetical protein
MAMFMSVHMQLTTTISPTISLSMQFLFLFFLFFLHATHAIHSQHQFDTGTAACPTEEPTSVFLKLVPSDGDHWVQQPLHPSTSAAHRQWI